jgi:3-oxoacyl-[acyl-carrier-protein] synthase II
MAAPKPRVVVTGMAGVSPLGSDWKTVSEALVNGRSAIAYQAELEDYEGMRTRLVAPVTDFETPAHYTRKRTRSMGRVSLLAARATELALGEAGLLEAECLVDGTTGISYGSAAGSPPALATYADAVHVRHTLHGIRATDYVRYMSHTVAANLAQFFSIKGRVIPTCSACTSGSQGIGYAFETIQAGKQVVMVAGGAEEYHPIETALFDVMYSTSTRNDEPHLVPRPFDSDRDGLVIGEGAGTLILEELEHARRRGAPILCEVLGFGTNCDGVHVTNPDRDGMAKVIRLGLEDAGIEPGAIGYINAHGTATEVGDIAESHATKDVVGSKTPISSLKSYMGHTLGACGALEAWMTIEMMREGWFAPTLNLDEVDSRCAELDYIRGEMRKIDADIVMSNNFAFGGINTSLIFRRWKDTIV